MEADCLSGSCPQKVIPGHEFLVAIKRESHTILLEKTVFSLIRSITLRAEARRLLFS